MGERKKIHKAHFLDINTLVLCFYFKNGFTDIHTFVTLSLLPFRCDSLFYTVVQSPVI